MENSENIKLDNRLNLFLSMTNSEKKIASHMMDGYEPLQKTWRLIVKYSGDIRKVAKAFNADTDILNDKYAIVSIREPYIKDFALYNEVEYIESPRKIDLSLMNSMREACVTQVNDFPQYNLKGGGVLIAVIDSGIDYNNSDFKNADGTSRIHYIWDQSISGVPPKGYAYGTEYTRNNINDAIAANSTSERLSIVPHEDYSGHGTHVSGIAAGNGIYRGVAPQASLLIVKLGSPDYEGYPINTIDIMFAVKYAIEKARELNMPLAINFSYGSTIGSHDGNSLFESYMDDISLNYRTSIVAAMGNECMRARHTSGNVMRNSEVEFVVCNDVKSISLDVWISNMNYFDLEVINPNGVSSGSVRAFSTNYRYRIGAEQLIIMFHPATPYNAKGNISIEIFSEFGLLCEGIWRLDFYPSNSLANSYDIWMQAPGFLQTCRFVNPTLENTITIPATVRRIISVSGYNHSTGKISSFSGRGDINGAYLKPDLTAPCENILSTAVNGGYTNMSGTSMAAPFVTGAAALIMEWGIVRGHDRYLYGEKLKSLLCLGAKRDKNTIYPNNVWGNGTLCLIKTMEKLI